VCVSHPNCVCMLSLGQSLRINIASSEGVFVFKRCCKAVIGEGFKLSVWLTLECIRLSN